MQKILGPNVDEWPCEPYGGTNKPERFNYSNGSIIFVSGLDKPSRILSGEFDLLAVGQVEELTLDDWQVLTTRTTGRAGHMPYSQTIGDANPAYPGHWLYQRDSLRLYRSIHRDNPVLYDQVTGELTEQGEKTMTVLEALTGVRRSRLLDGVAALAEGAIYATWDDTLHLVYRDDLPPFRRYVASQDWGFTNAGVLGVWGLDRDDRMFLVAQHYRRGRQAKWWTERAVELHEEYGLEAVVCDPSEPAYIAQYRAAGLNAVPGYNRVRPGIDAVQSRLGNVSEGKPPRLFISRDSLVSTDESLVAGKLPHSGEQEFPGYVWADTRKREQPVKEHDHFLDSCRYAVCYVDRVGASAKKEVKVWR